MCDIPYLISCLAHADTASEPGLTDLQPTFLPLEWNQFPRAIINDLTCNTKPRYMPAKC